MTVEKCAATPRPFAVAGDWHGDLAWAVITARSAAREGVTTLLHVGDFGLDWPGPKRARYEFRLNKHLMELGITLIVSGGNHDNWATIQKLPVESDGLATFRSNIRVLPRGGRTEISGLVVGGLGGAFSVDKFHRTEGKDWWHNEEPTQAEADQLIDAGSVDVLITHDAPAGIPLVSEFDLPPDINLQAEQTRVLLRSVVEALRPAHLFCGHWHQRKIHELEYPDGSVTRIDVLNREHYRQENAVLVWPGATPLRIEPLLIRGH